MYRITLTKYIFKDKTVQLDTTQKYVGDIESYRKKLMSGPKVKSINFVYQIIPE